MEPIAKRSKEAGGVEAKGGGGANMDGMQSVLLHQSVNKDIDRFNSSPKIAGSSHAVIHDQDTRTVLPPTVERVSDLAAFVSAYWVPGNKTKREHPSVVTIRVRMAEAKKIGDWQGCLRQAWQPGRDRIKSFPTLLIFDYRLARSLSSATQAPLSPIPTHNPIHRNQHNLAELWDRNHFFRNLFKLLMRFSSFEVFKGDGEGANEAWEAAGEPGQAAGGRCRSPG